MSETTDKIASAEVARWNDLGALLTARSSMNCRQPFPRTVIGFSRTAAKSVCRRGRPRDCPNATWLP